MCRYDFYKPRGCVCKWKGPGVTSWEHHFHFLGCSALVQRVLHQDNFIHCLFSFQLSQSRQAAITTNQRLGALKSSDFFLIVLWLEVHDQDASASSVRVATVCLHMALPLHMVLPLYLCIVGRREVCVGKRKRGRLSTLMSFYVKI